MTIMRVKGWRYKAEGTTLVGAQDPNGLWCADYKSEFMLGNKQYCYPLTITDYRSRYLLTCESLTFTRTDFTFSIFENAFKGFGLPHAIRTDNGVPFASGKALFGLSTLSVWWLHLGINLRHINLRHINLRHIKPGHPEQNGRHERVTRGR
jgi:putative transposase